MKQFALCLVLVLPGATAVADDWPQWQGPDRTAVSKEKGLLQEWPKDGPPLAWKANGIGEGMGGVAVSRGPGLHHRRQRRLGLALRPQRVGRQGGLEGEGRAAPGSTGTCTGPPARDHPDRRRRPDLHPRPARRPRLLHDRRQGGLARSTTSRTSAASSRSGASPSRRWWTATSSSAPPAPRTGR